MSSKIIMGTQLSIRSVGRPRLSLTTDEYIIRRRTQNKINKRNQRLREKLLDETNTEPMVDYNTKYRNGLIKGLSSIKFNYHLTGTFDLTKKERDYIKELNKDIQGEIQRHEHELNYQNTHINNLAGLKRYTDNYLNFLNRGKMFKNCVVFFELGKNKKYHAHILFQTPVKYREFKRISNNSWLSGHSTTTSIYDQQKVLKYVTKELEPSSNQRSILNLVDNWYVWNDMTPSPVPLSM
jgi:hypothetical protein